MPKTFVLIVNSSPQNQGARSALKFAHAVLALGHHISQVFFYQSGIYNSNALCSPASDEFDDVKQWQKLHQQHQVELITCVAASLRRGVVDQALASDQHLAGHNLADGFRLGGLGEFVTASAVADKLIQF